MNSLYRPCLEGQGDVVSRLIMGISRVTKLLQGSLELLT